MNSGVYLQIVFSSLIHFAGAYSVTFWLSQAWQRTPVSPLVKLASHPSRFWFGLVIAVVPAVMTRVVMMPLLLWLRIHAGAVAMMPASYGFSFFYGILAGLAASCCATSGRTDRAFQFGRVLAVSAVLIILPALFWRLPIPVFLPVHIFIPIVTLVVARLLAGEQPVALFHSSPPPPLQKRTPALALGIGFLPSIMLMGVFAISAGASLSRENTSTLLWMASGASLICCFTASALLFSRKTGPALLGGIVFLLLNGFIAFFCGCCASLRF